MDVESYDKCILANAPVLAGRLPFFTSLPDFLPVQHFSRVSTVI